MGHAVKKIVTTRYINEDGFEFVHEPIEDTLSIVETETGYEARYLVWDGMAESPDSWADEDIFLVNYHRDFWVEYNKIITENDVKNWYRGEFDDYAEYRDDENGNEIEVIPDHIPQEADYYLFPLSCLVHSGVWLSLHRSFPCDPGGWDTSRVGAVLVNRKEWKKEEEAYKAAESLVEQWNYCLTGDVYGIVKETYDKDKEQVGEDSCWGFYGYDYAMEALKTEI